jgi:hypothetical protein
MATITLPILAGSFGSGKNPAVPEDLYSITPVGDADLATCLIEQDGKYVHSLFNGDEFADRIGFWMAKVDASLFPIAATISQIQFIYHHRANGFIANSNLYLCYGLSATIQEASGSFDQQAGNPYIWPGAGYQDWTITLTTNPMTGNPWISLDLITGIFIGVYIDFTPPGIFSAANYDVDRIQAIVTYTATIPSVWYYNPVTNNYQYAASPPGSPWLPNTPTITEVTINPTFGSTAGGD